MSPIGPESEPTQRGFSPGSRVFNRYTLINQLGRGGMGVVWRARDEVLAEEVALKFLPDTLRWDPGAYDDLREETRRSRQLTHPNIVRIHDFVEDASGAAIAMELVDGPTLAALRLTREAKVLAPADLAGWLPQLCAALDYAHTEAGIVHRDLKPTNLMLTREGRLKITDFGVAQTLTETMTRVSMMSAGTIVYMSPQQAMGENAAPTDDIYALGATLYELLTGKPPFFKGDVRLQLFQRKPETINARRATLGRGVGPVPREWEQTIAACLAKEANARPRSAGEVARRLGGGSSGMMARPRWRTPHRRELGLGALAAALAGMYAFTFSPAASPVATTFPSDATRALAAWNFDGDTQDGSGRGLHGTGEYSMPTQDRFGRIDRALRFNGNASVRAEMPDLPILRWNGAQPFTAAIWVRQDESPHASGQFWRAHTETMGALIWSLGFNNGRPEATFLRALEPNALLITAPEVLPTGEWHHLALVSDGSSFRLYVDGRAPAPVPLGVHRSATVPDHGNLQFGVPFPGAGWAFTGALDEARLWRRALPPEEIAALVTRDLPRQIVITTVAYPETEDLAAVLKTEFGAEARFADWSELKRWHADDAWGWAARMKFPRGQRLGWIRRDGQPRFDDTRAYFLERFDGTKPEYFKMHDELGGATLVLGSWHGFMAPIIATLPSAPITTETLSADPATRLIRRSTPMEPNREALALTWRAQLTPGGGRAITVRLYLTQGPTLQAACHLEKASLALALGPVGANGGVSHNGAARFGEFEFTLVARAQSLRFRAASAVGHNQLFDESAILPAFRLADLVAIEIEGGPESALTEATAIIE